MPPRRDESPERGFHTADAPLAELLDACVRCGACVQSCPTYQERGIEPDDPRGRIFLIKAAGDGRLSIDETFEDHIYGCLDCRACETACPMGVQVGRLIEEARSEIRAQRPASGVGGRFLRAALGSLFPHPRRIELFMGGLRIARRSGAMRVARRFLPAALRNAERHMPTPPRRSARARLAAPQEPDDAVRGTVALLHGCVMNTVLADATVATAEVLRRNGWRVLTPENQTCCGALHVHEGAREQGKALARRNIDAFEASGADWYLVNAAGCGSALKEVGTLLRNDADWVERAERFAAKVRDVNEFLVEHGWTPPGGSVATRSVYQDACHLAHAQGIRRQPRELLRSVPGVELEEMSDPERCCGSAGIHNLTHPDMAQALLERKIADIPEGVDTLVTANPGCHLHLRRGLREAGREVRVRHVMEILDEAYRTERGASTT